MELMMVPLTMILLGVRHGFDSDHVAAIADMVGAEKGTFRRQVSLGLMYALGHGMIVLVIGLLAVYAGSKLPESVLEGMELLVGASLLVLGGAILVASVKQRTAGYVSRLTLIQTLIEKLLARGGRKQVKLKGFGIIGAFVIGIVHGIGAETPTQLVLISSAAGLSDAAVASLQIILFTVGLLAATALITLMASWGFMKARFNQRVLFTLGLVTGGYSLYLGASMLGGMLL